MRINSLKAIIKTAARGAAVLLLGAGMAGAQQQITLTAARTNTTLPDGSLVPMWGYSCGTVVSGSTATCRALNPNAGTAAVFSPAQPAWSPVVITIPAGATGGLAINLTNALSVPTSLTIVGQLGGGLGTPTPGQVTPHSSQGTTWPIAGTGATFTPPTQGARVQSFGSEVAANGGTATLSWASLNPGTYLIESGTHPSIQGPMGLYGILVVTTAPAGATAGTAYPAAGASPAVTYNADLPLLFSEIDKVQNTAVDTAVATTGFSENTVWTGGPSGCGAHYTCYPPAVNYSPTYYLINGVAFNKTNASASLFPASPASGVTGNVLVRMVNAGLRMHVPAIVGSVTGTPAKGGFSLIAEDGNRLPGVARLQNEVFMAAGKTYDVMINVPAPLKALPVYDRELSLSGNKIDRDAGMLAYIRINGAALPGNAGLIPAVARADTYNSLIPGQSLTVSDPAKGVIANDTNVLGVTLKTPAANGTVGLNSDGTFTYTPTGTAATDSFTYCANGTVIPPVTGPCSSGLTATVTLGAAPIEAGTAITFGGLTFTSNTATYIKIASPGVLSNAVDPAGYPLTVDTTTVAAGTGLTSLVPDPKGGFLATSTGPGTYSFTFKAKNSQGTQSALQTATLIFPTGSGLAVSVVDGNDHTTPITDYRWIIEEDRTFYVDPTKTVNTGTSIVPTFGTNFHTSYMPVVATGCTGTNSCASGQTLLGQNAVCDIGNGICRTTATQETALNPSQVSLNPAKRYYITVLPGDAADPLAGAAATGKAHGMGGAPIAAGQTAVTVLAQPTPLPPSKLSVFVFEDDFPLNGEQDGGGGIDVLSPNEPGLGQFNITIMDDAGGTGDATGQVDYDMFNQPLSNALSGIKDPVTGVDACPVSTNPRAGVGDPNQTGITGTIVTCPKYESDGVTLSPLAGQAVIANMMPGRYGVIATPAADRIARGEEWLQTNTLDGQKAHDSFLRVGEPSFFQEYGPAGYHVSIGFANPAIINGRKASVCNGTNVNITGSNCTNTVTGKVTTERMSRTPDERLYSSGSNDSFSFTQCYVSFGDPDGIDFAFTKCAGDGTFTLSGLPDGDWRVTVFDQWNDMLVDGLSTPVRLAGGATVHFDSAPGGLGDIASNQWQANIYTTTFFDQNGNGVRDTNEPGLSLVATNVRFRDGSFSNFNSTDLNGNAGFNEEFPLFNWYVVETDQTRYKNTGTHVVYDAGGPADGTCSTSPGSAPCGNSGIGEFMANTYESVSLPSNLRVPGAVYCDNADCTGFSIATGPESGGSSGPTAFVSTGRIDPPWVLTEGWQGFSGQNNFLEFGKTPYVAGENGGIKGHVVYASTRPFDDPQLLLQLSWEPLVPNVTINLYKEGTAPDGSQSLTLVDTTKTSSFDDWAQGFRSDGVPNMNCPGQGTSTGTNADLFFFSLYNQPDWLDVYNNGGTAAHTLPNNSQFKCYDGMHNWNQLQPAPYDGYYQFPSVTAMNPVTGKPSATNCTGCTTDPDSKDPFRFGTPMLPDGKYVVEMVVPQGYQLVKEEDKNILIGDTFIAPVTQEFPGLGGSIFILPDQAATSSTYNGYNAQNSTTDLGRISNLPSHEADTGSDESFWPCVGASRVVPDYISLFPQSAEVAPFAGATRNLCDRKEVTLDDQTSVLAKFYVFTPTHTAAHFTGVITDDYTSEFDPFSPQFGEKFAPPDLPISIKDWAGNEISRLYADHWGAYNGLTYSTWEVNPPNPTGYSPQMMVTCMNDPGTGATADPLFNPQYSQFCYELPFMPGQTAYLDTPVVPTSAFAGAGYNNPDCAYPASTPAIASVTGDVAGPWVSAAGNPITITALGDQLVANNAYSGPSQTTAPYNQKKITRHYGFGASTGTLTIGGVVVPAAAITSWNDTTITANVPAGIPACATQQQAQYGGPGTAGVTSALCGQVVITTAATAAYPNGQQSVDSVTLTVGGKAPTVLAAGATIQSAIDASAPGDLVIVPPGTYNELLLMWKPIRLQGVGAASTIINANTQPAGKIEIWRQHVNCLFGLALNGTPSSGTNPYDPTGTVTCGPGLAFFNGFDGVNPQIDRLPLEATVGWDATLNGNLAELLQEPTLMGALEGAGITVLSKGVNFPSNPFVADTFPTGTVLLTGTQADASSQCGPNGTALTNPFPSNFLCNPARIDGLGITDSSQGGGGIFVHGWGHNLEISNNRIYNNAGTLSGGINVGQGEFPPAYLGGAANVAANAAPGSCQVSDVTGIVLPYCHNLNVNIHNNAVMSNSSTGDELFSATPAGAGGVSFCTGADYYKFNYNWVCGNLSTGDGGGLGHLGFIYHGDIEHNTFLFNQATNPTIPTNGGGILIMGAPDVDPPCSVVTDADCVSAPGTIGPSDGAGPGLVINANLIMGNAADSGSGGGLRLQNINGSDVVSFPTTPAYWNDVTITNNIIANNVAGWDGAGVSLLDALNTNIVNNTIMSNDTTASSGVLFNTLGAPLASSSGPTCTANCGTASLPQPAGLVSIQNSAVLAANLPATITCPAGHYSGASASNGSCRAASYPMLDNNVIWQNRAFYIGVGSLGTGTLTQQHVVALYNAFLKTPAASQPQVDASATNGTGSIITGGTGACVTTSGTQNYWDIGVRGDTGPTNHASGVTLAPTYSVLTDAIDYPGLNNTAINPTVVSQYCNGSRVPPELGSMGYQVPPGISDASVPNPIFNLTPAATVDEGNNWINLSWGPLALTNPVTNTTLGNYGPASSSSVINYIPATATTYPVAPSLDFYGNARKANNAVDAGAIEFQGAVTAPVLTSIAPNIGPVGSSVAVTLTGTNLLGTTAVNVSGAGVTVSGVTVVSATSVTATFTIAANAATGARTVSVTRAGQLSNTVAFTVASPAVLTAPTPGSKLTGSSATFSWTAGTSATAYQLLVGTTGAGSNNIYNGPYTTALSTAVINIPTGGGTVYVRLRSFIAGTWLYYDYTFVEAGTAAPAVISTPAPGTLLPAPPVTFTWTTGSGVTQYQLQVGTTGAGSSNLFNGPYQLTTSAAVSTLPAAGQRVYVRLRSFINGAWVSVDYLYFVNGTPALAVLTTPTPGSKLISPTATFAWTPGSVVTSYQLLLGTTGVNSNNLYNGPYTIATTVTLNGLPTGGGTIYARLRSLINGVWQSNDYTYIEAGTPSPAVLTTPVPTTKLIGAGVTFAWTSGSGVGLYQLQLGTTGVGSNNVYNGPYTTATTVAVTGIPTNGGALYVRLRSFINGVWQSADYTYVEAGTAAKAAISSPVAGSTLTGTAVTFNWTTGSGVTLYQLLVGTTGVGSSNTYAGPYTAAVSTNVTGLPSTGGTVYVRLRSLINGVWQFTDYTYTAF